ncbi:LexA family protein [Desulfonatronovibrio magnus]|uniref:LexA family protein n=1 Tax=Desulfonatronovibrio magnus TaxID=698827 RepID=UPI00069747AC|nr:S24 family peptidase [Desulfonatronovibrio magnus]
MKNNATCHNLFATDDFSEAFDLPQLLVHVPAGFPSPADDYMDKSLDLNAYLVSNKAASFFVRVAGDSMEGAGILNGDILLIDRSLDPAHNKIVVAILNNELTVKKIRYKGNRVFLIADNPEYQPIEITEHMECAIWGVVAAVIRKL